MAQDDTIHHSLICKHVALSRWHLLNPDAIRVSRDCWPGHIVILFWCAAQTLPVSTCAPSAARQRRRNLAPSSPACRAATSAPRALPGSREAGLDIFIWSTNDSLKAPEAPGAFHWPSPSVPHLSSAYINRFSAPFTSSGAAVVKSALCHVHFKYLMLLEEMRSATVRPQPGAFLGCAKMEMFWNFNCATPFAQLLPLENLSSSAEILGLFNLFQTILTLRPMPPAGQFLCLICCVKNIASCLFKKRF